MAKVFAPFPIERTIGKLTFYMIEGRNFVRTKSSLTRRKVLYSPQFKNTRHNAGVLARASKIGSLVYNALPAYWRQGWMYRSFTGEAYKMLKAGKGEEEVEQFLLKRYVEPVLCKRSEGDIVVPPFEQPKRAYRKLDSPYWESKTTKGIRRKVRKQQTLYYAGLMARASKIGSELYAQLPPKYKGRSQFQYLTGMALKLLKQEIDEAEILSELLPAMPVMVSLGKTPKKAVSIVRHPNGLYYFLPPIIRSSPGWYNISVFKNYEALPATIHQIRLS